MFPLPLASVSDSGTLFWLGVFIVLSLVALGLLGGGVLALLRWNHLRTAGDEEFRARLDGPVELSGTASPASDGDSFAAAATGTECLISELDVQMYESSKNGGSWRTRESRTTTRPFHVETPGGTFRVEPDGAELVLETHIVAELDGGEEATGRTAEVLDALNIERSTGSVGAGPVELDYGDETRIREHRLDVGESVYVAGTAHTDDDTVGGFGGPDAVVREQTDRSLSERLFGFPFVVGDGGEDAIQWHFLKRGVTYLALGLATASLLAVVATSAV